MRNVQSIIGRAGVIRLILAFIAGLLLGLLANRLAAGWQNVVPYLLFPVVIGIAGALSVSTRRRRFYIRALRTGLAAWVGISLDLAVLAASLGPQSCTIGSCDATVIQTALLAFYVPLGRHLEQS
jgi:hypothetical protein